MRFTPNLNAALVARAQAAAARRGTTLSQLVEEGLQALLAEYESQRAGADPATGAGGGESVAPTEASSRRRHRRPAT